MLVDLTVEDIQALLEAIASSKQRISDAIGTPYAVRQENLARLDAIAKKLRACQP